MRLPLDEYCKTLTYHELLEERKAALFLLKELTLDSPLHKETRRQLGTILKHIREIERND